jgi:hypothetical protein
MINKRMSKRYKFLTFLGLLNLNSAIHKVPHSLATLHDSDPRAKPVFEEDLTTWKLFSNIKPFKTQDSASSFEILDNS